MPALQIEEINRTRTVPVTVRILAPAAGFVLARNVSPGRKFEEGMEWFRIADLSRAWILANAFQKDSKYLTAFADRAEGVFEPRQVETGWSFGGHVQIVSGLDPGERIETSSDFPACGMDLDAGKARYTSEYGGKRDYFCCPRCKRVVDQKRRAAVAGEAINTAIVSCIGCAPRGDLASSPDRRCPMAALSLPTTRAKAQTFALKSVKRRTF